MHKIMKKFILTEAQLVEYVEFKKAEKIFYDIVEQIHKNQKFLKEDVSHKKANQSVIGGFMSKKLINQRVAEMLIKYKITDETGQIILDS
jgi:hypothetical protein